MACVEGPSLERYRNCGANAGMLGLLCRNSSLGAGKADVVDKHHCCHVPNGAGIALACNATNRIFNQSFSPAGGNVMKGLNNGGYRFGGYDHPGVRLDIRDGMGRVLYSPCVADKGTTHIARNATCRDRSPQRRQDQGFGSKAWVGLKQMLGIGIYLRMDAIEERMDVLEAVMRGNGV